jgi:hypothetical protein
MAETAESAVAIMEEWIAAYADDPVAFVTYELGVTPDEWQAKLLEAVAKGERRISVRSGHGVGKSAVASWLVVWHLLFRFPQKTVITAPTSSQLFDALFSEVKSWINKLQEPVKVLLDVKSERIELLAAPSESFVAAKTSRSETPEALQGVHSDNVLLIGDEASGIPEQVFEAASGSMSGHNATTILLGNPTRTSGLFFDTHTRLKEGWWTMRVSCEDSPRVSKEYIEEQAQRHGEESNVFRVRVLGEFPVRDDDTMIPLELVESAMKRDIELDVMAPEVWGLDVARFGSDSTVLARRQGKTIHPLEVKKQLDLMQVVGFVKQLYDNAETKPVEILVDSIGVGAGVCDRLRELGLPARDINVSENPSMKSGYINLRAELWGSLKGFLEKRDCRIPNDEGLFADLVTPKYSFTSNGRMKLESKEDMKRRGFSSPDRGDAVALTMATEAAVAIYGTSYNGNWSKPIKRRVKGVV